VIRLLVAMLLLTPCAWAGNVWPAAELYEARAIVSGSGAATRGDAIVTSFRRVLVKVSGNPALLEDPRVDPLDALAAGMVEDFAYQDRMSDIPHHDEQGTRDRPFDVAVHFDAAKIDAALVFVDERPYRGPRPKLFIRIAVDDHGATFPLTADAEADERQREALLAAAERFGLRVVLPDSTAITPPPNGEAVLSGRLFWSEGAAGWVGVWRLDWPGGARDWSISGVSFDDAFRDAVGGSLRAFAGLPG
jgi:hypothetical protein